MRRRTAIMNYAVRFYTKRVSRPSNKPPRHFWARRSRDLSLGGAPSVTSALILRSQCNPGSPRRQILKEIMPTTSRIAVLGDSDINAPQLRELGRVAQFLALQTQAVELKDAANLDRAFNLAENW